MSANSLKPTHSTNRRIFTGMLVVVFMTTVAKMVVAAKEMVVADFFGTGEMMDAFVLAYALPMFATSILGGSFSAALIPTFIQTKKTLGLNHARELFSSTILFGIMVLIVGSVILWFMAPYMIPILGSGFSKQTLELCVSLFYWLLPTTLLLGIGHMYSSVINAGEKFAVVALVPAVTPIFAIVALLLFCESGGIYALAGGVVIGASVELLLLLFVANIHKMYVLPKWSGVSDEFWIVLKQYLPMVAGAFLMSGTWIIDQAMAASLKSGSVASLHFANKIVSLLLGISALTVGTVVLPHFSRLVANSNWINLRHSYWFYFKAIAFLSIPTTLILFYASEPLVEVVLQRGEFTAQDSVVVGRAQAYYILQLPFYVLGILTVRLISSLKANKVLLVGACISLPLNILLNYVLMKRMGISGIALSTSIVYAVSLAFLMTMLVAKMKRPEWK